MNKHKTKIIICKFISTKNLLFFKCLQKINKIAQKTNIKNSLVYFNEYIAFPVYNYYG